MLEREIKAYLVKKCKLHGIYHRKFTSPGHSGVPDWILIKNGNVLFVELKRPGGKPGILQIKEIEEIKRNGGAAIVVDTLIGVDRAIAYLCAGNIYALQT